MFEALFLKTKKITCVCLREKKGGCHLSHPLGAKPFHIPMPYCHMFGFRKRPQIQIIFQLSYSECPNTF